MKTLLSILIFVSFASPVFASQKYGFKDNPHLDDEFTNNYKEHSFPKFVNAIGSSETLKYLNVSSITLNGVNLIGSKVIQVVQGLRTGQDSTTSATFVNTSLSVTITPTSSSNRVLLMASGELISETNNVSKATLANNTTNLVASEGICQTLYTGVSAILETGCAMVYLDSPATTSAITYRVRFASNGVNSVDWGNTNVTSTLIAIEIAP